MRDFPGITFRDTGIGRQAYLRGTRLAVWMVALVARAYTDGYPDEIAAIADNEAASDRLAALLPPDQVVEV